MRYSNRKYTTGTYRSLSRNRCIPIAFLIYLNFTFISVSQAFNTVINLPNDTPPSSIDSDTQLNILNGGFLEVASDRFHVGNPDGSSENVELNLFEGGRILTRGFQSGMYVQAGGQLNIFGGDFQADLRIEADASANFTGGLIAGERPAFDEKAIVLDPGSNVVVSGGEILTSITVSEGSSLDIFGGGIRELTARQNTRTVISGGIVERIIARERDTGTIVFRGGDFRLNGVLIPEVQEIGSSLQFPTPLASGDFLSGTLADGTPFQIYEPLDGTNQTGAMFTLERVDIQPIESGVYLASTGEVPRGYRAGQTLIVDDDLEFFQVSAGPDSQVDVVEGGGLRRFEANGAIVNISGGTKSGIAFQRFEAFNSEVNMTGGYIQGPLFELGSKVSISGGEIGNFASVNSGSEATITGGEIASLTVFEDSYAEIHGGEIPYVTTLTNGATIITGGKIDYLRARALANVHLVGKEFLIDGIPIDNLNSSDPIRVNRRNVTLSGTFADGTPFSFFLNSIQGPVGQRFDSRAVLTVSLIPEPSSIVALGIALTTLTVFRTFCFPPVHQTNRGVAKNSR